MHTFPYTGFILESCQILERRGDCSSDGHLRHIVHLQCLVEELEAAVRLPSHATDTVILSVRDRMDTIKSDLSFPLRDCRTSPRVRPLKLGRMLLICICSNTRAAAQRIRALDQSTISTALTAGRYTTVGGRNLATHFGSAFRVHNGNQGCAQWVPRCASRLRALLTESRVDSP